MKRYLNLPMANKKIRNQKYEIRAWCFAPLRLAGYKICRRSVKFARHLLRLFSRGKWGDVTEGDRGASHLMQIDETKKSMSKSG